MKPDWERLGDEQAIRDVLARYWRGIDRQDPELVLGTYHPGAWDDHGYFKGPVEGFVETLRPGVWNHFSRTQHFAGNLQIDFTSADQARVESYAEAHHVRPAGAGDALGEGVRANGDGPDRDLVYGLRYVDDFERRAGEWRIARRVCSWDWHRVDRVGGFALPGRYLRGHVSREDPVYGHPSPHGRRVDREVLLAKQACLDALTRYTRGVDRCDQGLVRSAYHPDAWDDHGGYQGDVDGFLAWLKANVFDGFSCTMHKLGNVLIAVEGERAFAETYAIAHHVAARRGEGRVESASESDSASDMVMGIRYLDRFEKRGDAWKIAHRQLSFEWERALEIGSQRPFSGFSTGRRDGGDPVLVAVPASRVDPTPAERPAEQALADRAAILRQLLRYCRGVDRRDLELVRSTYHPDAHDDHGTYQGDVEGFLAFVRDEVHARFRSTQHKLGQTRIELDGDRAFSESYAICHHVMTDPATGRDTADMVMGIRYVDRFERRAGEWRIADRRLLWEWLRTDALASLDPGWTAGRVDDQDPLFLAAGRAPVRQNS